MATGKRVIVLEQDSTSPLTIRYVMRADVPSARQFFFALLQAGQVSAWLQATSVENTEIQSGAVREKVDTQIFPSGTTLAQAEAILLANWQQWQAFVTADNPCQRYGSIMDATNTWTVVNIP